MTTKNDRRPGAAAQPMYSIGKTMRRRRRSFLVALWVAIPGRPGRRRR